MLSLNSATKLCISQTTGFKDLRDTEFSSLMWFLNMLPISCKEAFSVGRPGPPSSVFRLFSFFADTSPQWFLGLESSEAGRVRHPFILLTMLAYQLNL